MSLPDIPIPEDTITCLAFAQTTGAVKDCIKEYLDVDNLETHTYIIYGVFGGLTVILAIAMFFACGMIFDLRKKLEERGFSGGGGVGGGEKNSDPLEQRGYAAYTGSQGPGMARQQTLAVAPPVQGNGYGAPAPARQSVNQRGVPPPAAPARRPTSGYGYDNTSAGYDGGSAGKPQQDWGQRFDKGMDRFDKVQDGFDKFEQGAGFADQLGVSQAAFGGNIGDMPGMDMAGDVSGYAGQAANAAKFGRDNMGAFKNKGFGKGNSSKLW